MSSKKFPRFFDVDNVLVRVDFDPKSDEVFGKNLSGNDFPPLKALSEGIELSEEEFKQRIGLMSSVKYPMFFDVEDILVKVESNGKVVSGKTLSGNLFLRLVPW